MTVSGMNESFTDETAQLQAVTKFLVLYNNNPTLRRTFFTESANGHSRLFPAHDKIWMMFGH